jgi:hypothetical protein
MISDWIKRGKLKWQSAMCIMCIGSAWLNVPATAQAVLRGIVKDSEGKYLPLVSVQGLEILENDTLIRAYALTDKAGKFELKFQKAGKYLLRVKALGYDDSTQWSKPPDSMSVYHFTLKSAPIPLKEVRIRRLVPIKSNDDTTQYNAQVFADGTEKNVEDLLRKLPGIQVSNNGKITAFGKSVSKVMIEGEDLFSKNYQIITRSLSAQSLEQIQVIENYSDNHLLKGIDKSNKVAINLKVRPNLSIRPFGNATGEAGYKNRYSVNAVGVSLIKKFKAAIVTNANNTGFNPVEANEYELMGDTDAKLSADSKSNLLASIPLSMVNVPDVEAKRVVFNKAKMVGLAGTYTLNKRLKLRGFTYGYRDGLNLYSGHFAQYQFEGNNISFLDSSLQKKLPKLWANQLRIEYQINEKSNIRYTFNHKKSYIYNDIMLNTQNVQLSERITVVGLDHTEGSVHEINYVNRFNEKNAFLVEGILYLNRIGRKTTSNSARYASFFDVERVFRLFHQDIFQGQQEAKMSATWKNTNPVGVLSIAASYSENQSSVRTGAFLGDGSQKLNIGEKFSNNLRYGVPTFEANFQQTARWRMFSMVLGGRFQRQNPQITNLSKRDSSFWYTASTFQPTIGLFTRMGNAQKLQIIYNGQRNIPLVEQFLDGYIQTNYRTFSSNTPLFFINKSSNTQITYSNSNWPKLYAIQVSFSFGRSYFVNATAFRYSNLIDFTTQEPIRETLRQWNVSWQIERLISPLLTKIKFDGYIQQSELLNRVNESTLMPNLGQNVNMILYAISAFDGPFNFQLSARLKRNQILNRQDKSLLNRVYVVIPSIILKYQIANGLSIKLIGEQMSWYNKRTKDVTSWVDIEAMYHAKASRWTFTVRGNNLTNSRNLYYTNVTNFALFQSFYTLQPRWASAGVTCSF